MINLIKKTLIISIFSFIVNQENKIIIDSNFKTTETQISVFSDNSKQEVLKSNIAKNLNVYFTNAGFGGASLNLSFNDKIEPKLSLWSDYNEFDDKDTVEIELESYKITINKNRFNIGDTIMGTIESFSKKSKFIKNNGSLKLKGDFFGIIGKTILYKKNGQKFIYDNKG